jgi:hypothetical protein
MEVSCGELIREGLFPENVLIVCSLLKTDSVQVIITPVSYSGGPGLNLSSDFDYPD